MFQHKIGYAAFAIVAAVPLSPASAGCINHRVDGQTIILQNTCKQYVSWSMCLNVPDRSLKDYPAGFIAPKASSLYGVFRMPLLPIVS
jgi:hypothetical protein